MRGNALYLYRAIKRNRVRPTGNSALTNRKPRGRQRLRNLLLRPKVRNDIGLTHNAILEPQFFFRQAEDFSVSNPSSRTTAQTARVETFGQRLRRLRKERGLSQDKVGEAIGLSQRGISKLEGDPNHRPYGDTLIRLADLFEVDPRYLLTGAGLRHPVTSLTGDESELLLLFRAVSAAARAYFLSRMRDIHRDEYGPQRPPPPPAPEPRPTKPGSEH